MPATTGGIIVHILPPSLLAQEKDPMEDFKRVFKRFASAEVVTGAVVEEEDQDNEVGRAGRVGQAGRVFVLPLKADAHNSIDQDARQERVKDTQKATTSDADSDEEGNTPSAASPCLPASSVCVLMQSMHGLECRR